MIEKSWSVEQNPIAAIIDKLFQLIGYRPNYYSLSLNMENSLSLSCIFATNLIVLIYIVISQCGVEGILLYHSIFF